MEVLVSNVIDGATTVMEIVAEALIRAGYGVDRSPLDAPDDDPISDYAVIAYSADGSYYVEASPR
jgi:hypothetical protein